MTFKQIQDIILENIQEIQKFPDFTLAQVKSVINRGYYDFIRKTGLIEDEVVIETVADSISYALDTYFYKIQQVRYIEDTKANVIANTHSEIGVVLEPWPGGWATLPQQFETGVPSYYWVRGGNTRTKGEIGTWPIAGTSSYAIKVWITRFPTADLTANNDIPEIKDAFHNALVEYGCWKLFTQYSHKDRAFMARAKEHENQYRIFVMECQEESFTETNDQFPTIQDVYL